jgi:trehalose 2-sulfotransferase
LPDPGLRQCPLHHQWLDLYCEGEARGMTRPLHSCVICTLLRSGSYLLCDLLSQTDYLGYPAEYYDVANRSFYNRLIGREKARDYNIVFDYAMRIGTTPNGMFGVKVLWHQLHSLKQNFLRCGSYPDWQPTEIIHRLLPSPRYIHLIRRDKLRQAICYCRAIDTGIWFSFADAARRVRMPSRMRGRTH